MICKTGLRVLFNGACKRPAGMQGSHQLSSYTPDTPLAATDQVECHVFVLTSDHLAGRRWRLRKKAQDCKSDHKLLLVL